MIEGFALLRQLFEFDVGGRMERLGQSVCGRHDCELERRDLKLKANRKWTDDRKTCGVSPVQQQVLMAEGS